MKQYPQILVGVVLVLLFMTKSMAQNSDRPANGARSPDDIAAGMIAVHNAWRQKHGLWELTWADDLAEMAQAWSNYLALQNNCTMKHSEQSKQWDGPGENIAWLSARKWTDGRIELQDASPKKVVDAWSNEAQWYDYDSNSCAPGRQCGHYTQVVWAETQEVGCAMAICPDMGQIWTCNYRPSGNIKGQWPY